MFKIEKEKRHNTNRHDFTIVYLQITNETCTISLSRCGAEQHEDE